MIKINEGNYRRSHTAPLASEDNAPLHNMTLLYPDDIYSSKAAMLYAGLGSMNRLADTKAMNIIHQCRDKPNKKVTVYRAVPKGVKASITRGDWVTLTKEYAVQHGVSNLDGNYDIVSKSVSAKDLYTDANSIQEFGYDPR